MQVPDYRDYEYGYGQAYDLAAKRLRGIQDIKELCRRGGALCREDKIIIKYLNQDYQINLPEVKISGENRTEPVPVKEQILILDYLTRAKGTTLSGKLITYKDLPEGVAYFRTFYQRTIKHLVSTFGAEPSRLLASGEKLGGGKAEYGDISVTIPAFPCVPITFILWHGDEEFSAEVNILFDSTVTDYLSVEDINVLCETITWKLVRAR